MTKKHLGIFIALVLLGLTGELLYFLPQIKENRRNIRAAMNHAPMLNQAVCAAFSSDDLHVSWTTGDNGSLNIQGRVNSLAEAKRLRHVVLQTHPPVHTYINLAITTNSSVEWRQETNRIIFIIETNQMEAPEPAHGAYSEPGIGLKK
jgi:hypothetical protein